MSITHVQSNDGEQNGGDTTIPVTFTSAPVEGNLCVIKFVSGEASHTAPTGYFEVADLNTAYTGDTNYASAFYKIAGPAETAAQGDVVHSGANQCAWTVHEYSSTVGWYGYGERASVGDADAVTSKSSGTTGTVDVNSLEAVALATYRLRDGTAVTGKSFTNSYTERGSNIAASGQSYSVEIVTAEKILTSNGTTSTSFSWTGARDNTRSHVVVFYEKTDPFADDFTGTNGDAPDLARWPVQVEDPNDANALIEIQSNELKMYAGSSTDDYASIAAAHSTYGKNKGVLFKFAGPRTGTANKWLYVCLYSSGEVQDSAAGRPLYAYYWRIDIGASEDGSNDKMYRRNNNTEIEMTDNADSGNIQIIDNEFSSGRSTTGDWWGRLEVSNDENDARTIRTKMWDDGGGEPVDWSRVTQDEGTGPLEGGLQFVLRNYNSSEFAEVELDDVEYYDIEDKFQHTFEGMSDDVTIDTATAGPDEFDSTFSGTSAALKSDTGLTAANASGTVHALATTGGTATTSFARMDSGLLETPTKFSSAYYYIPTAFGSNMILLAITNPANSNEAYARYVTSTGKLDLWDGSLIGATTTSVPIAALFRIDLMAYSDTATTGMAEMRLFTGGDVHKVSTRSNATDYVLGGAANVMHHTSDDGAAEQSNLEWTTAAFTPRANSQIWASFSCEAWSASRSDTETMAVSGGGLTWTKEEGEQYQAGQYGGVHAVFSADVGDTPSAMAITMTLTDSGATDFNGSWTVFDVLGHTSLVQSNISTASKSGGDSESHTHTLGSAPTSGNLVVGIFHSQNDVSGAHSVPTGYTAEDNTTGTYTHSAVFQRNDTTSTGITVSDLGQDIWWVFAAGLEFASPDAFDAGTTDLMGSKYGLLTGAANKTLHFDDIRLSSTDWPLPTDLPGDTKYITPGLLDASPTLHGPTVTFPFSSFQIWTGSEWVDGVTSAYTGATQNDGVLKVWNGSSWQ